MKFIIKNESKNRLRIHMAQSRMSFKQADILQYYIENIKGVTSTKVYERTCDAVIVYNPEDVSRRDIVKAVAAFHYNEVSVPQQLLDNSGRQMNSHYQEQLMMRVMLHFGKKLLLPLPIRACINTVNSFRYIGEGIRCLAHRKLEVPVLDATAIGVSILRGDFNTAGSVMFLLSIGELLEEWTHKKSVGDLARSMSLNVGKVWLKTPETEVLVEADTIHEGDIVIVHMGNVIPFDGVVVDGEGMINQAALTGESVPVRKTIDSSVYAGTVVEEGGLTIKVTKTGGASRYDKIVSMIEDSEKLKSGLESKAEHLADKLVPLTLGGTAITYLLTRNITKTLSVLMVDYSCALKMAMPISVLYAIHEAGQHKITVKGGKFLEAVADADTIVFDKTGTLTKAKPTLVKVVSFNGQPENELLRLAACLEEHFPHSMAKAVVNAAVDRKLVHEEMHSNVEYVVAHGISSSVEGRKVVIGSYHFVFEDENCTIPEGMKNIFDELPEEYSHLYMAIDGSLAAVLCIEDPLREEAPEVIKVLHESGFDKIVMMTGDSERTAAAIAARVGVDEYYSEVLPEDKARFVEQEKAAGRKVIMIGDGINDSPALSAADAGIAISDGAEIAREIADITISAEDLNQVVVLKNISDALMARIRSNYRKIVTINTGLIGLGVCGIIAPTTSALIHNTSTIAISLSSMKKLL